MKKVRVAINGFGRIGRVIARQILDDADQRFDLVAINDLVPADNLAYLLKYDSTHGVMPNDITPMINLTLPEHYFLKPEEVKEEDKKEKGKKEEGIAIFGPPSKGSFYTQFSPSIDSYFIRTFQSKDPSTLPWKDLDIDVVFECTGFFVTTKAAQVHLSAGAKKVIIGAPAKDDTPMYVFGVNHENYKNESIISMASCTTNCLAPIMKVLDEEFGVEEALMCTIHSITATQRNLDGPSKKDWRGGRACGESIIPSSTGAAKAVAKVLPQLKGKITGNSYRVPTKDGSVVDLTVRLAKDTTLEEIMDAFRKNTGVLTLTNSQLVSSDIIGQTFSSIVDIDSCIQLNPRFFKIVSWYDNESGYSARMLDTAQFIMSEEV